MKFLESDMREKFKCLNTDCKRRKRLLELITLVRDKRLKYLENLQNNPDVDLEKQDKPKIQRSDLSINFDKEEADLE
jgi:hypothetical protein